jgi:predicted anti-sigma-YlaC factor YlaD
VTGIFRDRPYDRLRHSLQRRARWVGTKVAILSPVRITRVGIEVLMNQSSKVQTTSVGVEVLMTQTSKVRISEVGVEVLMTMSTATIVPHIFEDYV